MVIRIDNLAVVQSLKNGDIHHFNSDHNDANEWDFTWQTFENQRNNGTQHKFK